jgi:hypothetical protein
VGNTEKIFVALLDEAVNVSCPVRAERLRDSVYRIVEQPYDRETEKWHFEPGDEVVCETIALSGGEVLAAVRPSTR